MVLLQAQRALVVLHLNEFCFLLDDIEHQQLKKTFTVVVGSDSDSVLSDSVRPVTFSSRWLLSFKVATVAVALRFNFPTEA